mmetsp:Transcript_21647/g.70292  ORF Transcript_21647/g.70292 Transcript_21647/m.70292 type:complete len:252 (+) Transcript_21647:941-1696(+)
MVEEAGGEGDEGRRAEHGGAAESERGGEQLLDVHLEGHDADARKHRTHGRVAVLRGVVCGQRDALFAPRNMRVQPAQQPYIDAPQRERQHRVRELDAAPGHRQRLPPRGDRGGGEERSREAEQLEGVALRRRHAARLCGDRVQVRPARAPAGSDERRRGRHREQRHAARSRVERGRAPPVGQARDARGKQGRRTGKHCGGAAHGRRQDLRRIGLAVEDRCRGPRRRHTNDRRPRRWRESARRGAGEETESQ